MASKQTKETRVKTATTRITKLYASLPSNQLSLYKSMIQNAAFIEVSLEDLQKQIDQEGFTESYQNGERQCGSKMSSAIQAYNATLKNYTTVMKQLVAALPPEEKKQATVLTSLMQKKGA